MNTVVVVLADNRLSINVSDIMKLYIYIYDTEILDYIVKNFSKSKGVPAFGVRPLNCKPKNCVHRLKGNDNNKYKSKGTLRNACVCTLGDLPTVLCNIHSLSPPSDLGTLILIP